MAGVLYLLAIAGYLVNRSYAARYGDEAIASHRRVLRLELAEHLARFLGGKLALVIALACAAVSLTLRRRRAPTLLQTVCNALAQSAALAGAAATCADTKAVERCAEAIKPFAALGKNHAASATNGWRCTRPSSAVPGKWRRARLSLPPCSRCASRT